MEEISALKTENGQIIDGKVEQIKAFKTTDGQIFEDKGAAEKHQDELDFKAKLTEILDNVWYRGVEMEDVIETIVKHREELR